MTTLGYILLPVGLVTFLFSRKWLYRLFVFSTLFSATSAINFGEGQNASGLQVWMFFGFLWILRLTFDSLSGLSLTIDRRFLGPSLWLLAFVAVACVSLAMPLYIDGALLITAPILGDNSETPLVLTSHNISQVLYLLFGGIIAICVAHANLAEDSKDETERIILISAIFVSLWGLFQFFCNVTGFPYPDSLFNNSASESAKGFLQTFNQGMKRVSSTAVEPSMLAQSLITLLPLTIPAWFKRGHVITGFVDRCASVLFVVVLLLSTSSTAYLGIFLFSFLLLVVLLRTRTISMSKATLFTVVTVCSIAIIAALAIALLPLARDVLTSVLVDKSSSGSALERAMTITLAFGYFQKYPLLGIGWGSATSHDLIVKLLSNVGVIGALAFLAAMWSVIRSNWKRLSPLRDAASMSRAVWFLSLSVFLGTSLIIEFPLVFGNFWLVLGMAISSGATVRAIRVSQDSVQAA